MSVERQEYRSLLKRLDTVEAFPKDVQIDTRGKDILLEPYARAKVEAMIPQGFDLSVRSKLAQTGLDAKIIERDTGGLSLVELVNVGPHRLIATDRLELGLPYRVKRAREEFSKDMLSEMLQLIKSENPKLDEDLLLERDIVDGKVTSRLLIRMNDLLFFSDSREIILSDLSRGTDRKNLHKQLGLSRSSILNPSGHTSIYTLAQTAKPISYPHGLGILMDYGWIKNKDEENAIMVKVFHGESKLGQSRPNDSHPLIGEYHIPCSIFDIGALDLFMACRLVKLDWVSS